MRYLSLLVAVLALVASCSQLDMKEARYRNNLKDYDALIEKAAPELREVVESKKKAYEEAHAKLPSAEQERIDALVALNAQAEKEVKELETQVEAANKERASADAQAMAAYRKSFVGTWEGDGMRLRIGDDGTVDYERKSGAVNKSLTGTSIKEFRKDSFDVSLLGVSTTFRIDQAPKQSDGAWTMTIDGAKLTRVGGP
jgi:dsDNA-specific endonuclease/ATPase MutS2